MQHEFNKHFSIYHRMKSFRYAFRGIFLVIRNQHNCWIHLSVLLIVIILGIIFSLTSWEWCIIILTSALVLSLEAVNTALEYLVDMVSPQYQKQARDIKDIAAGAVLISAVAAVIAGLLIFLPKFMLLT